MPTLGISSKDWKLGKNVKIIAAMEKLNDPCRLGSNIYDFIKPINPAPFSKQF